MQRTIPRLASIAIVLAATLVPTVAFADSIIVLGIRSVEGDDEFSANLSGVMRHAVSQVSGWELNPREVSLAQMLLAHGCEESDIACMDQIGNTLGVEKIVYGTVRRTSTGSNFDYAVSLYLFDAAQGAIREQVTDTIPSGQSDVDQLRARVARYVHDLTGAADVGMLRIQVNVPNATVVVDGDEAGSAVGGVFEQEMPVGPHMIEVRYEGHRTFRARVSVTGDEPAMLEVSLSEGDESEVIEGHGLGNGEGSTASGGGGEIWPALLAFGLGAVGVGLTVASWVTIQGVNTDLENTWRPRVGGALMAAGETSRAVIESTDSCAYMDNEVGGDPTYQTGRDLCSQGKLWELLQYVFIGTAAVGLGVGAVLLVTSGGGSSDENPADQARLRVTPTFGLGHAGVNARLDF